MARCFPNQKSVAYALRSCTVAPPHSVAAPPRGVAGGDLLHDLASGERRACIWAVGRHAAAVASDAAASAAAATTAAATTTAAVNAF